ncbi:MAG: nucleotidyltransferase family protein [Ginsengibacter sp.]
MIKEAIILAGGLGTRLRSVISELPKCMAPVAGKPFLAYVIRHLEKEGIKNFIFSVGYKNEIIVDFINAQFSKLNSQFSIEEEPLGTGGAVKLACAKTAEETTLVVNGDTLFSIKIKQLAELHDLCDADCTLNLKLMQNFDRYGVVELNEDHSIRNFKEKKHYKEGLINGGVYALNSGRFLKEVLPVKFSFEKDYLEKYFDKRKMYGVVQNEYFIDIGIPQDYERVQQELANKE